MIYLIVAAFLILEGGNALMMGAEPAGVPATAAQVSAAQVLPPDSSPSPPVSQATSKAPAIRTNTPSPDLDKDASEPPGAAAKSPFWKVSFPPEHYIDVLSLLVGLGAAIITAALVFAAANVFWVGAKLRRLRKEVDQTKKTLTGTVGELSTQSEKRLGSLVERAEQIVKRVESLSGQLETRLRDAQSTLGKMEADHLDALKAAAKEAHEKLSRMQTETQAAIGDILKSVRADQERWNFALHGEIKVSRSKSRIMQLLHDQPTTEAETVRLAAQIQALMGEILQYPDGRALEIYYTALQKFPTDAAVRDRVVDGLQKYFAAYRDVAPPIAPRLSDGD